MPILSLINWKWILIAVVAIGLITVPVLYVRGAEKAKGKLAHVEGELHKALIALETNHIALETCLAVNSENMMAAAAERERAKEATKRVQELERQADQNEDRINDQANTLRTSGLACPAINNDFRLWMRSNP